MLQSAQNKGTSNPQSNWKEVFLPTPEPEPELVVNYSWKSL